MSKLNFSVVLCFVIVFASLVSKNVTALERDALTILRKVAENQRVADRIQYEITTQYSQMDSASRAGDLGGQYVEAAIKREGNNIAVIGLEKNYRNGVFVSDEKIHRLVTSDFGVYGTGRNDDPDAGMVTTKQINRLITPILCSGRFGFEMDGYIGDGARIPDLMLMEPDKVKFIGDKEINGYICVQIDADTAHGFFSVHVDTENNYAVRRIVSERRQSDLQCGGKKYFQNMPHVKTFTETVDNLEFTLVDGMSVPTKGILLLTRRDRNGDTFPSKSEFKRKNVNLNPDFGEDTFSADFLKGEVISNLDDNESGVVYLWDGEKPVPGYTMLEGIAFMQGYAGYIRLFLMLVGILMIAFAIYRMLIK